MAQFLSTLRFYFILLEKRSEVFDSSLPFAATFERVMLPFFNAALYFSSFAHQKLKLLEEKIFKLFVIAKSFAKKCGQEIKALFDYFIDIFFHSKSVQVVPAAEVEKVVVEIEVEEIAQKARKPRKKKSKVEKRKLKARKKKLREARRKRRSSV